MHNKYNAPKFVYEVIGENSTLKFAVGLDDYEINDFIL